VSVTGNITGGNVLTAGQVSATGNVTGNYILGNGSTLSSVVAATVAVADNSTNASFALPFVAESGSPSAVSRDTSLTYNPNTKDLSTGSLAGTLSTWQVNVKATTSSTSTATGALKVAGGVGVAGNVYAGAFYGAATGLTSIPGGNVTGTVPLATSATTAGTVTTAAQPNITSVGSLTSLTVGNILNSNANAVGNIGNSTVYFNTIHAKATSALYADLAERFLADQPYAPGTVLIFGGENEVTQSVTAADHRVAGVVSTNPSYIMNAALAGPCVVDLALQGRVPCDVVGPVEKGDLMVSAPNGRAQATKSAQAGTVIGKSLENFSGTFGRIEIVIGRD
jgi:hypothetical protein